MHTGTQAAVEFDKQGQLDRLRTMLMRGERLLFVYDCKGADAGYLGLTTRRLLFEDRAFIPGRPSIVSLPLASVRGLFLHESGRLLRTAKLVLTAGAQSYEFRFRSDDKARNACRLIRMWTSPPARRDCAAT